MNQFNPFTVIEGGKGHAPRGDPAFPNCHVQVEMAVEGFGQALISEVQLMLVCGDSSLLAEGHEEIERILRDAVGRYKKWVENKRSSGMNIQLLEQNRTGMS